MIACLYDAVEILQISVVNSAMRVAPGCETCLQAPSNDNDASDQSCVFAADPDEDDADLAVPTADWPRDAALYLRSSPDCDGRWVCDFRGGLLCDCV